MVVTVNSALIVFDEFGQKCNVSVWQLDSKRLIEILPKTVANSTMCIYTRINSSFFNKRHRIAQV